MIIGLGILARTEFATSRDAARALWTQICEPCLPEWTEPEDNLVEITDVKECETCR